MPSKGLHVRMPDDLRTRLDRQAERRMIGRSKLVCIAVERLVSELEDPMDQLDNYLEDN